MSRNVGDKFYKYNYQTGKMSVHEGEVKVYGSEWRPKLRVYFAHNRSWTRIPKDDEIGVLCAGAGMNLWLTERNDELAKDMFIRYEMECIADLEDQLNRRQALLKMLIENEV